MASALFRDPAPDGYTPRERVERTRVPVLRDALVEAASVSVQPDPRLSDLIRTAGTEFKRRLMESMPTVALVEPAITAAFAQSGELGDIRSFQTIRLSPEQRRFVRALRAQLAGEEQGAFSEYDLTVEDVAEPGTDRNPTRSIDFRVAGEFDTDQGPQTGHAEARLYPALGYLVPVWNDAGEIAARLKSALQDALGDRLLPRPIGESELLLLWAFTGGEFEDLQIASAGYESATRSVRNRGLRGSSIEQSERINAQQRSYGPLEAAVIRTNWIRDSRGTQLPATMGIHADGTISFGSRVEPHVVDRVIAELAQVDASPALIGGIRDVMTRTHTALSEAGRGAALPPLRSYVEDAERRLESHLRTVITPATGAPVLTPRRCQTIANLVFCGTIARLQRSARGAGPRLSTEARATLGDSLGEIKNVFAAGCFPAAGPEPSIAQVASALAETIANAEAHGTDVGALFEDLRDRV